MPNDLSYAQVLGTLEQVKATNELLVETLRGLIAEIQSLRREIARLKA